MHRSTGRRSFWAAAAIVAALVSGCGTGGDQTQAGATGGRFLHAYAAHDGEAACAALSPSLRQQVMKDQAAQSCAAGVTKVHVTTGPVATTRVFATSAVVTAGPQSLFLGDDRGTWQIDAFGCRPHGKRPYDCEEQA